MAIQESSLIYVLKRLDFCFFQYSQHLRELTQHYYVFKIELNSGVTALRLT